jgi:hypothetical protein
MSKFHFTPTKAYFVGEDDSIELSQKADVDAHIADTAEHGATGAVVGTTNTQTLTNKTIYPITQSRTATADGTGTGAVGVAQEFVQVTSANAAHIITLPDPAFRQTIRLRNGATGYELRTSDPETIAINGGTGAAAESAIGANVLTVCVCDSDTTWVCTDYSTAGVVSATEVAAP